ncbi:MAG: hypothetical protein J6T39_02395, partial [Clostridia bacterium]|nr:hypothetical protein [Clostridia bacterium]
QILFIDRIIDFKLDDVNIRKGENTEVKATLATSYNADGSANYVSASIAKYAIGVQTSSLGTGIVFGTAETNVVEGMTLFQNNSVLTAVEAGNKTYNTTLYYVLTYTKLSGSENEVDVLYIPISTGTYKIVATAGATAMSITSTDVDITLLDEIFFTILIETDDTNEKLVINLSSTDICPIIESRDNVELTGTYGTHTGSGANITTNSKLILTIAENEGVIGGTRAITFSLKFNSIYQNLQNRVVFDTLFETAISFVPKSVVGTAMQEELTRTLNIVARPQALMKIDFTNYPAGKVDGNVYKPASLPSNTLTPGQVGYIEIDIYPEYATYDQIELISGTDNQGNYINFIQVAKIVANGGNGEAVYAEIKPNSVLTENGIILRQISNYDEATGLSNFDGKFYVKTLMGTNVSYDQVITITVVGTTTIKNESGEVVDTKVIRKTLDIIVNEAPELKLQYMGDDNKSYVKESNGSSKLYNLVAKGDVLDFEISHEKLAINNIDKIVSAS